MRLTKYSGWGWTPVLGALLVLGSCTDGPTGPAARGAIVEAAGAQHGQVAEAGAAVPTAPAVLVRDARGLPVAGATVRFTVVAGGGTLRTARVETGADGVAGAGQWTLGSVGVNEVEAVVGSLPAVRFTAMAVTPGTTTGTVSPTSAYTVDVRYVNAVTARQRLAVDRAVAAWRSVIVGDLPAVQANAPANTCFAGQPALNEVVDDILIYVEFSDIDGAGKVLGQAGPCFIRNGTSLPVVGELRLDRADLDQMERAGTLDDVVTHEMGHILGFGTLWPHLELIAGAGGPDPYFTGAEALAAYRALGGSGAGAPVENTGGDGTREGHWRESVFGSELMTGYIRGLPNPLSALTIASLRDLGYDASAAAAGTYTLGAVGQLVAGQSVDLRGRERILTPRYGLDRDGRRSALPDPPR
ncbi:MAG TPA: leishmanolysin-related zinc metalloendopeptidase [Longimicrobiales bacterium]